MDIYLQTSAQWAKLEFGGAPLNDERYAKRLVKIANKLVASPGGTLPQAFPRWADLKAAYRFFAHPANDPDLIQSVHRQNVLSACCDPGEYLIIEDTTQLDFTGRACEDMGQTFPGGRGLFLHTTLAVRVESWDLNQRPEGVLMGVMGQQYINRPSLRGKGTETRRQMQERLRESDRWAQVLIQQIVSGKSAQSQWVFIADREADFYEPIQRCRNCEADFIIRAFQDRRVADSSEHYLEKLAQGPVLGKMAVKLRARPGQAARMAVVEVRCEQVTLQGPYRRGQRMEPFTVNAIEVREVSAPEGVEPIHWVLLTSLKCDRWSEIQRVIGRYCGRWWVEEFHKALKTGTQAEESQMHAEYRIESLVAVLSVVAVRLLNLKLLARGRPDEVVDIEMFGEAAIKLVERKFGPPQKGQWTHRELLRAIARMGGFIGRRSDGEPGWQTIWRGWKRLMWMAEGVELIQL